MIFEMLSRVYGVPKQVGVEVKKIFLILAEKNKMRSPQTLPHGGGGFYSRVAETTWRKFLLLPLLFVFISLVAMDAETIVVSLYTYTRRYRLCWPACQANCAL
jgi:hypothetical protein